MTSDETSQLFPILQSADRSFEVTMRGYDRNQVDDFVARTDAEMHALHSERDAAMGRSADLAAQLANSHAQIEAGRRQLAKATEEITGENVHARLRPLVENAHAEARQIRQSADADATRVRALADADSIETRRQANYDAEQVRQQGQADLQRASQAASQRTREADETLASAQATAAEHVNKARADATKLLADAHAEVDRIVSESTTTRQRLDAQAARARVTANEDFEIALRVRRTEEQRVDQERRAASQAEAQRVVFEAQQHAQGMVAEATAEVQRLHHVRDRTHADLTDLHRRMGEVLSTVPHAGEDPAAQPANSPDRAEAPTTVDPAGDAEQPTAQLPDQPAAG